MKILPIHKLLFGIILGFTGPCAPSAIAASLVIGNAGFENPEYLPDGWARPIVPYWGAYGGVNAPFAYIENPTAEEYPYEAPEGDNVAVPGWQAPFNVIFQALSVGLTGVTPITIQPQTRYTLDVMVGNSLLVGDEVTYSFALKLVNGSILGEYHAKITDVRHGAFERRSLIYTSPATLPEAYVNQGLVIDLGSDAEHPDMGVGFDDVRLDATVVPEPDAFVWLLAGGVCSAAARNRRSRSTK